MSTVAKPAPVLRERKRSRVAIWREQHAWACAASLHALRQRPFGTLLTVAVMGFALALPLAFYLLLANVQRLSGSVGESRAISVFLQPPANAAVADALANQLRARADISDVAVKTPQQGLSELASVQGFGEALHALAENPLPYVLLIQPRQNLGHEQTDALVKDLRALPHVDGVQDNGAWRARLDAFIALGQRITALLAALLALAALGVTGNSVRLDIRSRSEEIIVQRLVGASAGFVRRPFLYEGVWYGALAGLIAIVLVIALESGLAAPVHALSASYDGRIAFGGLPVWLLILVPLAAALLGWVGAFLASTRHLANA